MAGTTLAAEAAAVPAGLAGREIAGAVVAAAVVLLVAYAVIRLRAAAGVIDDVLVQLPAWATPPAAALPLVPAQRGAAPAWAHLLGDDMVSAR